ncbi:hypothetical protein G6F57_000932 [Rhizopus arrhizus]|uniref:HSF-type DNA-binding domain-containing protein n=1 Tax=Rhizopus oryzae TaxID=64495 RepID=A0A9P6X4Q6_RHIOR|nr:hypothetical protein G6F23_006563 [Rhizopus arrhizus]KAG1417469.1 hypothetical protein G6F58_005505 [Rhizopus delemar]KAG0759868.1 hypothetical protein G6F24_008755 [Rhizopus arrhizus]KAG0784927.1 hypothetical protein G6F22_008137 [Rhizopus arrhizus]KAG0795692.1 hypothetical protein G6F21_001906 [Rhizopus arrhizus]
MEEQTNKGNGTKPLSKRGFVERFFRVTPTKNAAFVSKLYEQVNTVMVNDESTVDLITWTGSGDKFTICNNVEFSSKVLPRYFKHCNWSSFVRQLNMYGFHKINETSSDYVPCNNAQQRWDFKHPWFTREGYDKLHRIRRKQPKSRLLTSYGLENDFSESSGSSANLVADVPIPTPFQSQTLDIHDKDTNNPTHNMQINTNSYVDDVTQLICTTEDIKFKVDSTSKEVRYLRQITATQQKILNELLVSVEYLKSKALFNDDDDDDDDDDAKANQQRKPRKIHELLSLNSEPQIEIESALYDSESSGNHIGHDFCTKRRKT